MSERRNCAECLKELSILSINRHFSRYHPDSTRTVEQRSLPAAIFEEYEYSQKIILKMELDIWDENFHNILVQWELRGQNSKTQSSKEPILSLIGNSVWEKFLSNASKTGGRKSSNSVKLATEAKNFVASIEAAKSNNPGEIMCGICMEDEPLK